MHTFLHHFPDAKQLELQELMQLVAKVAPQEKAAFYDGKDKEGKVVTNPALGIGNYLHHFSDGRVEQMYRIGISPNATGFSIYVLGLKDKEILKTRFANSLGKAKVTGYCIKFKSLKDLDEKIVLDLIKFALHYE
ncbi:MAG: hypothetical protein RLZZ211_2079 [Bacteroidota bacterium]|jgi:hypothetical protein